MLRRIALIAGESSGDQLGADLIRALRRRHPRAVFFGVAGPAMCRAGCKAWADAASLAHMGLTEVVKHLPGLLRLRRNLIRQLLAFQPDCMIGIDAPDFNLKIEAKLRNHGIPTIHYVSPSIWAWREKRAAEIGASADRVLCLFPFEPEVYARHNVPATYVGHPFADQLSPVVNHLDAPAGLTIDESETIIALLPGSRKGEVERLGEVLFESAAQLTAQHPQLHFLVPAATPALAELLTAQQRAIQHLDPLPKVTILSGNAREILNISDLAILASGTASLEAMLCATPMVVVYKISPLTHFIVKSLGLMKIERFSLPNVLHGDELVPELIQNEATPKKIAAAASHLLNSPEIRSRMCSEFAGYHRLLRRGASEQAAQAVTEVAQGPV